MSQVEKEEIQKGDEPVQQNEQNNKILEENKNQSQEQKNQEEIQAEKNVQSQEQQQQKGKDLTKELKDIFDEEESQSFVAIKQIKKISSQSESESESQSKSEQSEQREKKKNLVKKNKQKSSEDLSQVSEKQEKKRKNSDQVQNQIPVVEIEQKVENPADKVQNKIYIFDKAFEYPVSKRIFYMKESEIGFSSKSFEIQKEEISKKYKRQLKFEQKDQISEKDKSDLLHQIRFKQNFNQSSENSEKYQSNAKIYQWDDGTFTLRIGKNYFYNINENPQQNSYLLSLESNLNNQNFEKSMLVAAKIQNSFKFEKIKKDEIKNHSN